MLCRARATTWSPPPLRVAATKHTLTRLDNTKLYIRYSILYTRLN